MRRIAPIEPRLARPDGLQSALLAASLLDVRSRHIISNRRNARIVLRTSAFQSRWEGSRSIVFLGCLTRLPRRFLSPLPIRRTATMPRCTIFIEAYRANDNLLLTGCGDIIRRLRITPALQRSRRRSQPGDGFGFSQNLAQRLSRELSLKYNSLLCRGGSYVIRGKVR